MQDISFSDNAVLVGILDEGTEPPEYYLQKSNEELAVLPEVVKGIEQEIYDFPDYYDSEKPKEEWARELLKAVNWNNVREILKKGT